MEAVANRNATDLGCLVPDRLPGIGSPGHSGYRSNHQAGPPAPTVTIRAPLSQLPETAGNPGDPLAERIQVCELWKSGQLRKV